jgi:hypothetical protein
MEIPLFGFGLVHTQNITVALSVIATQCDRVQQIVKLLNLEEWIDEDTEPE